MRVSHVALLASGLIVSCVSLDHLGDGVRDGGDNGGGSSSGGGTAMGGGGASNGGGSALGGGSANPVGGGGGGLLASGGGAPQGGGGGGGIVNPAGGGSGGSGGGSTILGCSHYQRGGPMVQANGICIDVTEVTMSQYQKFLTDPAVDAGSQISDCAWNSNFHPAAVCTFDPTASSNFPVSGEDWCDAMAFCKWAGKRLCGGADGGATVSMSPADFTHSERTMVCTRSGAQAYPYGNTMNNMACNGGEQGTANMPGPAGSFPLCDGGYPGVFDLAGNLHEWENVCEGYGGGVSQNCWFRGGSYHDLGDDCGMGFVTARDYFDSECDIGFRCCADP